MLARLRGEVAHRARWEPLNPDAMAGAVAALHEILDEAGRQDGPALLAQVAGLYVGGRAWCPELLARAVIAASICVAAGADEFAIDGWTCVGAERAADTRVPGAALLGPPQPPSAPG